MEEIINALLDVVREQQRSGIPPEAAMSRSDVVNMALKMMQQQGTEIEQDTVTETWRTVLRMAPKLFGTDTSDVPPAALHPSEQIIRKMEPDKRITEGNENIALDKMIFDNFQNMMGKTETKEIKEEPAKPAAPVRPKSAAELAADAIKEADEMKRKGIKPPAPKPGQRRPVTNKVYKGIPKAATKIRDKDAPMTSASQLAYEAQKSAQQKAAKQAEIRAELEERIAKEAMARGEKDPRIVAEEERAKKAAAIREMEIKRAAERGEAPPDMADSCANMETEDEKKARIAREQEERRKKEWEQAEAEAKAAKEKAAKEREERYLAEQKAKEEAAKRAREMAGMSEEERKAAEARAAKRAKAKEEAKQAKEAKSAQTKLDAAKLIQERAAAKTKKAQETAQKAVNSIQEGMAAVLGGDATEKLNISEEDLNKLVMEKYQELIVGGTKPSDIDMTNLTTMVIEALSKKVEEEPEEPEEDLDAIIEEAWGSSEKEEKEASKSEPEAKEEKTAKAKLADAKAGKPEKEVAKADTKTAKEAPKAEAKPAKAAKAESKEAPKKVTKPAEKDTEEKTVKATREKRAKAASFDEEDLFASFKNVKSIFGDFEEFLSSSADQRYIRTGIEPVDHLLSEGLEAGLYMVRAEESIGADNFTLQMADYMASKEKDVLYLLSDTSRYNMMIKSISRLTYELREKDKDAARSAASIMNCQSKEDMAKLAKEFKYYEDEIGEHLYLMEQKQMDADNIAAMIMRLAESFEKNQNKKPVVIVDDIFWMIQDEPELLEDLANLADDLNIPIIISVGAGKLEDADCITTFIQITYADSEGSDVERESKAEKGETLLTNLKILRRDTGKRLTGKMAVVPKFHYFGKM